ncbi:hypothetical protein [Bradyrhizobium sp. STM 3557]|uniref:hypothetical protein n=1 Tax=Bradyrhizobium sp. STM 3557 TaxID=578920 RepID=UPI00388F1AA2
MAHKDVTARRSGKSSQATPMAQQRPDLGAPSAPQTLVRLVGCHDARTKKAAAASTRQAAPRSRPRH